MGRDASTEDLLVDARKEGRFLDASTEGIIAHVPAVGCFVECVNRTALRMRRQKNAL